MTKQWTLTDALVETIVSRLCEGESLRQICRSADMPSRDTVMRWQEEDPAFAAKCARAREWQADLMDDKILETAEACTVDNFQAAKVKISAYQWRASKLAPKRYGDKIDHTLAGADGGAIEIADVSDRERAKALAALVAKAKASAP